LIAFGFALVAGLALASPVQTDEPCPRVRPLVLPSVRDAGLEVLRFGQITGQISAGPLPSRGGSVFEASRCATPDDALLEPWRPGLIGASIGDAFLLISMAPIEVIGSRHRTFPLEGRLNGPRWPGRGDGAEASLGVRVALGPVSLSVAPVVTWSENAPFEYPANPRRGFSPYAHAGHPGSLDLPRRHGDDAILALAPGESELRAELGPVQGGVSTRNLHWGPARRNPMVLSPAGPGFPHLFLGTRAPLSLPGIGLSLEWILGELSESRWFDNDPRNDRRRFQAAQLSLVSPWIPGLEVGLHQGRVTAQNTSDEVEPALHRAQPLEIGAVFARWVIPEAGTEVYAEWGRQNLISGWLGRAPTIEGANAFAVGVEQATPLIWGWLRVQAELTSLRGAQSLLAGGTAPSLYTDGGVVQGYTHRGALLGAPIGPGADAQSLGFDWMGAWGAVGVLVERIRFDDETYARNWAEWYAYSGHDVELRGSIPWVLRYGVPVVGVFEFEGDISRARRWNRHFTGFDRLTQPTLSEWDTSVRIGVRWRP
jgi:hypothetical protein